MNCKALYFLFVLLLSPLSSWAETKTIGGINYEISAKFKTATVVALSTGKYTGDIVLPDEITVNGTTYPVTAIGGKAFYSCQELTAITLPSSITSIGEYAFSGCSGLKALSLPESLTAIERYAFSRCSSLTSIRIPGQLTTIAGNAFDKCGNLASVYLSDGVTTIDNGAFADCSALTRVRIPNTVTDIGTSSFFRCTSLKTITIPESVQTLPFGVFWRCSALTSIVLSDSIRTIGDYTFCECKQLTTVYLGKNVSDIGTGAFSDCPELTDVYCCMEGLPHTRDNVFQNSFIDMATLHVPETAIDAYSKAEPWNGFQNVETFDIDLLVGISDLRTSPFSTNISFENSPQAGVSFSESSSQTGFSSADSSSQALSSQASTHRGIITVTGVPAGTALQVFDLNGRLVGSAKAESAQTHIITSLRRPQIVLVRAGDATLKVSLR